jgi:hypothetical protein
MYYRVVIQVDAVPDLAPTLPVRYMPEMLRHIGRQVEALMSQYNSLKMHKRAIE